MRRRARTHAAARAAPARARRALHALRAGHARGRTSARTGNRNHKKLNNTGTEALHVYKFIIGHLSLVTNSVLYHLMNIFIA